MGRSIFYTTEKIGPKQSLTPEGFLLCEEVAIARTGMMIYGPDEVPVSTGPDGVIKIFREEDEVFRPETMASAQGKPVTNEHPKDDVTPDSWKELTHGIAMNVRRGSGSMDDLLLADFLITTPEGIEAVQSGKREVSCGYEADYEETSVGVGLQSNIIINHIALVENGRCGPRCAISDHQPTKPKGTKMAKGKSSRILDALMKAFKAKDADEVEKLAEEIKDAEFEGAGEEAGGTHIHIHANGDVEADPKLTGDTDPISRRKLIELNKLYEMGKIDYSEYNQQAKALLSSKDAVDPDDNDMKFTDQDFQAHVDQNTAEHAEMRKRIEVLEAALAGRNGSSDEDPDVMEQIQDEVPEELKEEVAKAKDSAYLGDSFADTVAMAEILVPGISVPTFDRAAKIGATFNKICGLRRQALDLAYHQPSTRVILDDLLGGKDLDVKRMTCDAARVLFRSAASVKRTANNANNVHANRSLDGQGHVRKPGPMTLAELNKANTDRYTN